MADIYRFKPILRSTGNTNSNNKKAKILNLDKFREERDSEVIDFQEKIVQMINDIIENGIIDFSDDYGKMGNYYEDTIGIWNEMKQKTDGAQGLINYINSIEDEDFLIYESAIIGYIIIDLSLYREIVFKVLESKYIEKKKP